MEVHTCLPPKEKTSLMSGVLKYPVVTNKGLNDDRNFIILEKKIGKMLILECFFFNQ